MLKVCVIGLGAIGNLHSKIYNERDDCELTAVCDIIRQRAEDAGKRHNTKWYTDAGDMLGKPYFFTGTVSEGRKLGRTLGFPTANLIIPETKILPKKGVYFSKIMTPCGEFKGISNIGVKPTVDGEHQPGIETYIYDFTDDLYGEEIQVKLFEFIRPEKKFANVEELKEQVNKDIETVRKYT